MIIIKDILYDEEIILRKAVDQGILDLPKISDEIAMTERKRILKKHPFSVWENKNGKWITYLPADNETKRKQFVRNTQKEIEDLIVNYWREEDENPTIKEVFEEWNTRRGKLSKVTMATCTRDAQRFETYFKDFGLQRIKNISRVDIEDFLEEQIAAYNMTAKEFANLKSITRGLLKRAKKRGFITINVNEMMNELDISDNEFRRRVVDNDKEVYFDKEMNLIMDYIKEHPKSANLGVALMFVTGIRVGELAALKKNDFNGQTFKVCRTETRFSDEKGKCHYEVKDFPKTEAGIRTVIVPGDMMWIVYKAFQLSNPDCEYLFTNTRGNRIPTFSFRKEVYKLDDKFSIPHKSPHKIRKTYCSILLDNGVESKVVERQVGHVDVSITENYYHFDRKNLDEKIDMFNTIPQFKDTRTNVLID